MSDSVPVGAAPDVWDIAAPSVPNSARMYDYYLGGKDNFPVDREAAGVLRGPEVEELIDFDRPCGVLMMSVLHFVGGDIAPLVARYTDRLAPGSFLALSHVVTDGAESGMTGVQRVYEASPTDPAARTTAAIRELFTGFELQPPGLTDVRTFTDPTFGYSPDDPAPGIWMLCALGRKL